MRFDPIEIEDLEIDTTNLIELNSRRRYECQHARMEVDEAMAEVRCKNCKEKLNPIWVLMKIAGEQSRYIAEFKRSKEIAKRINEKEKTRCEHCNRMTRVAYKKEGLSYL